MAPPLADLRRTTLGWYPKRASPSLTTIMSDVKILATSFADTVEWTLPRVVTRGGSDAVHARR